jgi:hypothetical protein
VDPDFSLAVDIACSALHPSLSRRGRTRPAFAANSSRHPGVFVHFHMRTLGTRTRRAVSASQGQPIFLKPDSLKGETMTNIVKAHQHFASAVESLACGAGPIQYRLCEAAGHIANVDASDIPDDLRDRF